MKVTCWHFSATLLAKIVNAMHPKASLFFGSLNCLNAYGFCAIGEIWIL